MGVRKQGARSAKAGSAGNQAALEQGLVIAAHGRHYLVQAGEQKLNCVTRGKKSDVAVGDHIRLARTSADQGVVESIDERRTLLYRSDQYKSKLLAANVDQLFIVVKQGQVSPVDAERAREVLQKGKGGKEDGKPGNDVVPPPSPAPAQRRGAPAPGPAINSGA